MGQPTRRRAVILFEHPLLGEGLATRLRVEAGVEVVLAPVHDRAAVEAALHDAPQVVVIERRDLCLDQVRRLAPGAEVVDVSAVVGRGLASPRDVTGFDRMLRALRSERVRVPAPSAELRHVVRR